MAKLNRELILTIEEGKKNLGFLPADDDSKNRAKDSTFHGSFVQSALLHDTHTRSVALLVLDYKGTPQSCFRVFWSVILFCILLTHLYPSLRIFPMAVVPCLRPISSHFLDSFSVILQANNNNNSK